MSRGHRGDIQGLRAVAVLLVALDHARVGPFHGGFVGVDVFYVVSGFLITSLLLAEVARDGRISLTGFYARRARRILPAATFVLVVTVAASVLFLSGVEALGTVEDATWATFFAANYKFAADGTDYFQAGAPPSPLQHYWSLSVEEQFYLVWPLAVLLVCVVALRRGRGRRCRRRTSVTPMLASVLSVVVVASFAWSVVHTLADPVTAYFSPLTRAWELGLGALAACLVPRLATLPRHLLAGASWLGLAAVLWSALTFDAATLFPGYVAAVPVLGSALLLVGGLGPAAWGPQRLLTVRPMRVVGDWSYSLYLWHWPVLVVAGAVWGPVSGWTGVLALGVGLALAGLSYVLIENPFRRARSITLRPARGLLLYPAVLVLVLPAMVAAHQAVERMQAGGGRAITTTDYGQEPGGAAQRLSRADEVALVQASVLAAENGMQVPGRLSPSPLALDHTKPDVGECEYNYARNDGRLCPLGDTSAGRTVVLVGDSHALQWAPAIETLAERHGYTAYFLVRVGCPGADVTPWLDDGTGPSTKCEVFQDWAATTIEELRPAVTLIGSELNPQGLADDDGNHVTDPDQLLRMFEAGMRRQVERVAPSSGRVILIGDPPATPFPGSTCLSERDASLESCMAAPDPFSRRKIAAARAGAVSAGAEYVDTAPWFCAGKSCPAVIGRFVPRRDLAHVTVEYAVHLTDALGRELDLDRVPGNK